MQPKEVLKKYWGFDEFRPLQEEIIQSVLDKQDTLALLPTGGGKSLCFQVPAMCMEGVCIVVSPLIALMKDQVYNLKKRGIPAVAIYSGMNYKQIDIELDNAVYGQTKLLYMSPERLQSELAIKRISLMNVSMIAVDEAHCISQWGYDFRPSYLNVADIREIHPDVPVIALTATATPDVVDDIQEKLLFKKEQVFQKSFARDNLAYVVLPEEKKLERLVSILQKTKGSGVVYVRNRRKTKEIAAYLHHNRISADFYHAGLSSEERSKKQENWIDNKTRIIVSTNAFGMGIDKADVRVVVHMDLPDSLEAYFQEAGRGGRDGKKSFAILLYQVEDKFKLEGTYKTSFPPIKEIKRVYQALGSYFQLAVGGGIGRSFDFEIVKFSKTYSLELFSTFAALKILQEAGWIVLTDAIFIPATFKILVSKNELYTYQIEHRKLDKIIKTMLRAHHGAFMDYVHIRESPIANFLKIPVSEFKKSLGKLQQDHIIDYIPAKDKPQLIFTKERVDVDVLTIDKELFEFRKKSYFKGRYLWRMRRMPWAHEGRIDKRRHGTLSQEICAAHAQRPTHQSTDHRSDGAEAHQLRDASARLLN